MTKESSTGGLEQAAISPGLFKSDVKRPIVIRIAAAVEESQGGFHTINQHMLRDMLRGMLMLHDLENLTKIEQALFGPPALSKGIANQLMQNVNPEMVRDTLRIYPLLGIDHYLTAGTLLKSVRHYWQLPELEHFFDAPAESQAKGIALMKVTHVILEERKAGNLDNPKYEDDKVMRFLYRDGDIFASRILDKDLIQIVIDNHDRADEIVSIIQSRQMTDARIISAILDGIAPSLAEGSL